MYRTWLARLGLATVSLLFCVVATKEIFHDRAPEQWNWELLWGVPIAFGSALQELRLLAPATRFMAVALPLACTLSFIGFRLTQSWICLAITVFAALASFAEVRQWKASRRSGL
ncbi:MAG: hypothetical protein ACKVP7_20700 [Hyphomicrobiaceae bacterium]